MQLFHKIGPMRFSSAIANKQIHGHLPVSCLRQPVPEFPVGVVLIPLPHVGHSGVISGAAAWRSLLSGGEHRYCPPPATVRMPSSSSAIGESFKMYPCAPFFNAPM